MKFITCITLSLLGFLPCISCQEKLFPDIGDLFKFDVEPLNISALKHHDLIARNVSIDVEKVDIKKLWKKMPRPTSNETFVNDTRRQIWVGSYYEYQEASLHMAKMKVLDIMLQTIYMARHKYFNSKDTSYRIAFLYRTIRRIWKKIHDIYNTMERMS
ncbi:unnamed protein product [Leptidea sinapis]|uniref:Uncharacterized protein n=1 Tax=Leptidea sinapis TaxID=189913 RepID=A0A5E4QPK5_9NEOP|nr:unnamed protein product [Leptidea sinapis]